MISAFTLSGLWHIDNASTLAAEELTSLIQVVPSQHDLILEEWMQMSPQGS